MRKDPALGLPQSADVRVAGDSEDLNQGASLSGHERNHLFLNDGTGSMDDVSGLSGLDHEADGRALGWFDFDRDGWLDFAVVNANGPTLQLFRNEMGTLAGSASHQSISVQLVGGNESAIGNPKWSNRDGVGARLEVALGDRVLVRELRAGEGFAAQNSATMHVGLGDAKIADRVSLRWPSGRTQSVDAVPAGSLVIFREKSDEAKVEPRPRRATTHEAKPSHPRDVLAISAGDGAAPLRVYTTMATWCETCRGELPDIAHLRESFPPSALELIGVPVDENDTPEMLAAYIERYAPRYRMLQNRTKADVDAIQELIQSKLRRDVLPASVVTNASNEVIDVFWGLPTVSDLKAIQENS